MSDYNTIEPITAETESELKKLGMSDAEIAELKKQGGIETIVTVGRRKTAMNRVNELLDEKVRLGNLDVMGVLDTDEYKKRMLEIDLQIEELERDTDPFDMLFPGQTKAMKNGGEASFPDLSGDGKVTQKDILMGRGVIEKANGGEIDIDAEIAKLEQVKEDTIFDEAKLANYLLSLGAEERDPMLKALKNVGGIFTGAFESMPIFVERLIRTGDIRSPDIQIEVLKQMKRNKSKGPGEAAKPKPGMAEGGEIDMALQDVSRGTMDMEAPQMQPSQEQLGAVQQIMDMVMQMMQSGASEEEIIAALKEMGLSEQDIAMVMQAIVEQGQQQNPIDAELSQMM